MFVCFSSFEKGYMCCVSYGLDHFFVTSCNTTFLDYVENVCQGGHILHTGDKSTFVPRRQ
jgi:hypothetical protein